MLFSPDPYHAPREVSGITLIPIAGGYLVSFPAWMDWTKAQGLAQLLIVYELVSR